MRNDESVSCRLPLGLKIRLEQYALNNYWTTGAIIREAIIDYLYTHINNEDIRLELRRMKEDAKFSE